MMKRVLNLANSTVLTAGEFTSSFFPSVFQSANESDRLRWVCIAPYGDWPNAQGLQRFDQTDAKNLVNQFNGIINTPQRMLGLPWYIGHPDHPNFANKYKDTKAYGRIKQLEARNDGLYAGVKLNDDGEKILASEAFDGHSVNWFLKPDKSDKRAFRPVRLKSVGWTNEPNISVPTFTTANEDANGNLKTVEDMLAGNELFQTHKRKVSAFRAMANEEKYTEMKNSFGPWKDWDACILHMTTKGGYNAEEAKKVCGRLQADLGEKPKKSPNAAHRAARLRVKK